MSATEHAVTARPPASSSAVTRMALPWQPCTAAVPPPPSTDPAAHFWAATISSVPYLSQAQFSGPSIVYKPPTVIQLSEATGCSVSELAGHYNDLPVIQLCKELRCSAATSTPATETQTLDSFDYLQLVAIDETLELAANAVRARRPVPDAEETFWEADYWEKLKRAKQEQQQRKDVRRQKKLAQEGKKELAGPSVSTVGLLSTNTVGNTSAINSPSFMTPHSRQGSLGGHTGDVDTLLTMANLQSAQRQKRIAKGLLRRARYNESHNPSHAQMHITRSASSLSQNSVCGSQHQPVIRCRTRPRSNSTYSQQTDVRGFQYSLSSAMSEGGRSVLSDSLRTPPPLSIIGVLQSREALMTSLDTELSTSGGVTKSGAATHSRNSAAGRGGGATTPRTSPPREESMSSQRSPRFRGHKSDSVNDPTSSISPDSKRPSPRVQALEGPLQSKAGAHAHQAPNGNTHTAPRNTGAAVAAAHALLATPVPSPSQLNDRLERTPSKHASHTPPLPPALQNQRLSSITTAAFNVTQTISATVSTDASGLPASPGQIPPSVDAQREPIQHSEEEAAKVVMKAGLKPRRTTARPSPATRLNYADTTNLSASAGASRAPKTTAQLAPVTKRRCQGSAASSTLMPAQEADQSRKPLAALPTPPKSANEHLAGASIPILSRSHRPAAGTAPEASAQSKTDSRTGKLPAPEETAGTGVASAEDAVAPPSAGPPHPAQRGDWTAITPRTFTSTQGPSVQETSPVKSTLTATPSGSVTPRATAATVPPSRTSTREASISPRIERAVAVRSAAPTSPAPLDGYPVTWQQKDAAATPAANTSPSLPKWGSQLPLAPTRPPSREGSGALQDTSPTTTATTNALSHQQQLSETKTHVSSVSPSSASRKGSVSMAKTKECSDAEDLRSAAKDASATAQPTPSATGGEPSQVISSAAAPSTTTEVQKAYHHDVSADVPEVNGAARSSPSPATRPKTVSAAKPSSGLTRATALNRERKSTAACCVAI
ncbi:hypothetical protein ABL78_0757 [Leptomonas seymouri]|uniref:Uncharacterized protein n=1 Tax=Leptomonas seymouri TaxID=5684 RepID=A0A0N1PF95_LEPSE|nr:hypothetical protein ABL78_0757 [Leptomonas seymouri]|eukprot:KPI90112.1 hypothetical protein ABL78_0757 [Leptomonas seymouri]